jgi:ammonium transporter Rh
MAITGSTISACAVSRMWTGKLNMEVVLNATLSGGIIIGSCCCLIVNPVLAIIIGAVGGIVSSLGYLKLNSFLQEYAYLYDTCGVQFLHGIPGLLGGIAGAFVASNVEFQMRDNQSKAVYYN